VRLSPEIERSLDYRLGGAERELVGRIAGPEVEDGHQRLERFASCRDERLPGFPRAEESWRG
jgi:hypothetical protein